MFFRYSELHDGALSDEKTARADAIAASLSDSEVREVRNRYIMLRLPGIGEPVEADVSLSGLTFYLGGFDWVTYPTPQHILQRFPEFLPLPQQVFRPAEEEF